jgi:hypothetical protein
MLADPEDESRRVRIRVLFHKLCRVSNQLRKNAGFIALDCTNYTRSFSSAKVMIPCSGSSGDSNSGKVSIIHRALRYAVNYRWNVRQQRRCSDGRRVRSRSNRRGSCYTIAARLWPARSTSLGHQLVRSTDSVIISESHPGLSNRISGDDVTSPSSRCIKRRNWAGLAGVTLFRESERLGRRCGFLKPRQGETAEETADRRFLFCRSRE